MANLKRTKGNLEAGIGAIAIVLALAALYPTSPLRRWIHESLLARATSAHYEFLFPSGSLTADSIAKLTAQHEQLFNTLDAKIGDAGSNATIRIVFDSASAGVYPGPAYTVNGATVRTFENAAVPIVAPAADAEALLNAAWGKAGNPEIANWTAHWLVGEWDHQEIGMAAAGVEHSAGHMTVAKLLAAQNSAPDSADRTLLGAAWISEVAELGGSGQVQKLYSTKFAPLDLTSVSQALGTTTLEVERKWQLWIFAYVAGMPTAPAGGMPANMHMGK